jgi:hypothetical protein
MAQLLSTNVSGTLAVTQNTTVSGNLIVSGYNVLNEIFQADNLTRVSANSGSTQSAVALNFVNTATVTVSVTSGGTGVANIGFTSTATGTGSGINNFPVSVNTTSTITSNGINFVNTSSVSVIVSQGIGGNANISFTASPAAGVTQVATGLGLTGGPITSTGTISANIANTTVQGVTKLIDSVTSTDAANAATGAAVKTAYDQATTAYGQANLAYSAANTGLNKAQVSANGGSIQSNVGINFINTASVLVSVGAGSTGNANVGFSAVAGSTAVPGILQLTDSVTSTSTTTAATPNSVKSAFDQATLAYGQANAAFSAANTGLNKAQVSANGGSVQSNVGINFNNTASVLVSVGAGTTGNANIAFSAVAGTTSIPGILQLTDSVTSTSTTTAATPNSVKSAYDQATLAYGQANTSNSTAVAAYGQANAAFSAANTSSNTVQVSANSGGTLSKVSLNFNNTATIRVNVGAGSGSNANLSFDYIGSVTGGGGGINNFPVSANSGSTVTANGLNFVNTSTTTISVSADSSGNANVSITSKAIQTEYYSSVYSNKFEMMGWVHNRDGKIFSLGSSTPVGIFANTSGTRFYVIDSGSDTVNQLNLSEAWNIASATTESANLSVAGQDTNPVDLFLKSDGSVLYVLGDTGDNIISYPLSESWNVRSNGAATESTSLGTGTWTALFFKEDGSKMYVGNTSGIVQFSLGTNWDVSTRTLETSLTTSSIDSSLQSLSISPDGNFLYIVGGTNDRMYELKMSTAFNVATASYNNFFSRLRDVQTVYSTETAPTGMFVAYPNNRMYLVGTTADTIIQYDIDKGVTVEAKKLFANGKAHFMDDVFIVGDMIATEGLVGNEAAVGTSGQFTISTSGGVTAPTVTVSGTTTLSGSIITSGNNSIDLGVGTGNTTTNLAIGATNAGNTKNIRIGTGGAAGSLTNILIGPSGANATINVFANTTTFSNTVDIQGQLTVSGLNIVNEIGIADNLARVSANSGSVQSAVALNFVNTSTVTVSVTPGDVGVANISFSSSGSSGVTSVAAGLGLTSSPNPIVSTGTISANIASTTDQGITKLIDSVTSTDAANAATGAAVKTAYDQATSAYGKANTAHDTAVAAFGKANTAHDTAVAAYGQANSALNKVQVSANGGSIQSNVAINFVNTQSIIVSVGAGSAGNANVSFSAVSGSTTTVGILQLTDSVTSTSTTTAATPNSVKLAYDLASIGANTTSVSANSGSLIHDGSLNFNNTATIQVSVTAGISGNANVSFSSHIANGSITSAATITPLRTGPHNHYAVTALAVATTIDPPAINTGKDGDRLTIRIEDNGTGRGLTWNTAAGAYRAVGVTLPTTTVATKVLYIGSIYNSTDNFWDVVAYVVQA